MCASFAVLAFLAYAGHGMRMQVKLIESREGSSKHEAQEESVALVDSEAQSMVSPWKTMVALIATLSAVSPNAGVVGDGQEMIPSADAPTRQVVDLWNSSGPLDTTWSSSGPLDTTFGSDLEAAGAGFFGGYEASKDADWEKIEADNKKEERQEVDLEKIEADKEVGWRRKVEAGLKGLAKNTIGKLIPGQTVDLVVNAAVHEILKNVGKGLHKAAEKGEKIQNSLITLQLDGLKPVHTGSRDFKVRLNHDHYQIEVHDVEIDINLKLENINFGILGSKSVKDFVVRTFGPGVLDNMQDVNILAKVRGGVNIGLYHDTDGAWEPHVALDGGNRPPSLRVEVESIEYHGEKYDNIKGLANALLYTGLDKPLKGLVQKEIKNALKGITNGDKWFERLVNKALNLQYSRGEKRKGDRSSVDEGEDCLKSMLFCASGMVCHKVGDHGVCGKPNVKPELDRMDRM